MESQCAENDSRLQEAEKRAKEAEAARDAAIMKQKYAEDSLNSIEYEFEAWKEKAKAREHDLVTELEEVSNNKNIKETVDKEQMQALEQQLSTAQQTINRLQVELEQGQEKIKSFESSLAMTEVYKLEMNKKVQIIAELKKRLQATQDKINDDQQAFDNRDELAREQVSNIEKLNAELVGEKEIVQTLTTQLQVMIAQNSTLTDKVAVVDRFEEELAAEKQHLREALTELNELRTINVELKQKVASAFVLERELNDEKERSNNLLSKVEELHAINSDLNLKMFNVENREQEMEVEKEKMQKIQNELFEYKKKLETIKKLETELSDSYEQLRILNTSLHDVKNENIQMVETLELIKTEVNKAVNVPKNDLKALMKTLKQIVLDPKSRKSINSTLDPNDLAADLIFESSLPSNISLEPENYDLVLNETHDKTISYHASNKTPKKVTITELESQIFRLSQAKLDLESELARVLLESEKLSGQIENLIKDKVDLAQELAEARLKHEEEEIKCHHQMTELKSQIDVLRQANEEEINDLTVTTETLQKDENDFNRECQLYEDQIEALRRENEELRLKANEKVNESNKLTAAKAELLTQIAELRSANTLEASELLVQEIERGFYETVEQSDEIERSFDEMVQQTLSHELSFSSKEVKSSSMNHSDISAIHKRELDELRQVLLNLQLKHEQELIEIQSQITTEQTSIETENLTTQLNVQIEKVSKLEAEIAELQTQLSTKHNKIEELESSFAAKKVEFEEKIAKLSGNLRKTGDFEVDLIIAELQKARNELQSLKNEKIKLQNENDELSSQIMEQVEENDSLQNKLNTAESELSKLEKKIKELKSCDGRLSALEQENLQLKDKLAADSSIIETVQQESEELRGKLSQLMAVVQEKEQTETKITDLEGNYIKISINFYS